ncbi:kinase A anchor protein [Whalleya microplaca]|nr:kinase A anchor protein [Whalleya microplaca]
MAPQSGPTHFLCIPLVNGDSRPQLMASLSSFKADVTSPDSFGIPATAIRPLGTIHLTLGVMSLPTDNDLERAIAFLKTLEPQTILSSIIKGAATTTVDPGSAHSLSITLRGLQSMHPPSNTSVLYAAPVDAEGTLFKFCEALQSRFQDAGLISKQERPLKLHATILNTIYVKGKKQPGGKRGKKLGIDAHGILDRYDDFVWMEDVPVEKIAICKMGAEKQEDGDEAYKVVGENPLI